MANQQVSDQGQLGDVMPDKHALLLYDVLIPHLNECSCKFSEEFLSNQFARHARRWIYYLKDLYPELIDPSKMYVSFTFDRTAMKAIPTFNEPLKAFLYPEIPEK